MGCGNSSENNSLDDDDGIITAAKAKAAANPKAKATASPKAKATANPKAKATAKATTKVAASSPEAKAVAAKPTFKALAVPALNSLCRRCFDDDARADKEEIDDIVKESSAVDDLFATLEELQDAKETEMKEEKGERLALALELLWTIRFETNEDELLQKPEYVHKLIRFFDATSVLYCRRMAAILFVLFLDDKDVDLQPAVRTRLAAQLIEIVNSFSDAAVAGAEMEENPMLTRGGKATPEAVEGQFCSLFSIVPSAKEMWNIVGRTVFIHGERFVSWLVRNGFLKPAVRLMAHDSAGVATCGVVFLAAACGCELVSFEDMDPETYLPALVNALAQREGEPTAMPRTQVALMGLQRLVGKLVTDEVVEAILNSDASKALLQTVRRCTDTLFTDADVYNQSLGCIQNAVTVMEMVVFGCCMHAASLSGKIDHCWNGGVLAALAATEVLQCFFLTALPKYEEDQNEETGKALMRAAKCICGMALGKELEPVDVFGPILNFMQPRLNPDQMWAYEGLKGVKEVMQQWVAGGRRLGKLPFCLGYGML